MFAILHKYNLISSISRKYQIYFVHYDNSHSHYVPFDIRTRIENYICSRKEERYGMIMEEADGVVSDMPSGLITCVVSGEEVGIEAIAPQYIQLRFPKNSDRKADKIDMTICFLRFLENRYERLTCSAVTCVEEKTTTFYVLRTYHVESEKYRKLYDFVIKQYYDYIMLKVQSCDQSFTESLTGYPAKLDDVFAQSYEDWLQKDDRAKGMERLAEKVKDLKREMPHLEIAVSLENRMLYQAFLEDTLSQHIDDRIVRNATRYYIGNQFCHNLFPEKELLFQMLEKARMERKQVTLAFSYLREELTEETESLIADIYHWCHEKKMCVEIIVNDYGFFEILEGKQDYLRLSLGTLLNKRRKDPRYAYKIGASAYIAKGKSKETALGSNALGQPLYQTFLSELGIIRYEQEACGYDYEVKYAEEQCSLHMPFYQTNTSQYCPLYALCIHGDRGKQQFVKACPCYCEQYICAYPEHLHMVGKYNSLMALDMRLLATPELLESYVQQGIDRLVWNAAW